MHRSFFYVIMLCGLFAKASAQDIVGKATGFISTLDSSQRAKALYPFDNDERLRFNFVPLDDRKGISVNELSAVQRNALTDLLRSCLSEETVKKVHDIMQLDIILKELEHRKPEDHFRDPGKYFVTIFGIPSATTIWG